MRYDEMRRLVETQFRKTLKKYKERVLAEGDPTGQATVDLRRSLSLVDDDFWLEVADLPDDQGNDLLSRFKALSGIGDLSVEKEAMLLAEIQKGYRSFLVAALEYNELLGRYDLGEASQVAALKPVGSNQKPVEEEGEVVAYAAAMQDYLTEGQRGNLWAAKTVSEKRDALELLAEITGNKPTAHLTKADARMVKGVLVQLPKNRSKDPRTRGLSLADMLIADGVPKLATRTVNAYLSAFQSFCTWAVNNGHASENIFVGTRLPRKSRDKSSQREAFDASQLRLMFKHLVSNPDDLVGKDDHKWPTLIAMFTGARLNEVAQLHVSDIRQHEGIWCIDINDDDGKMLKTSASRRVIPVHEQLLDAGLIEFVASRSGSSAVRMFPSFSYSAQNGYGRNVGRWFNERFLPAIALKRDTLVFHSLRHSMVTLLSQADVPDIMVKAILGHEQASVTHTSYFKSGFTVEQLKREIDKFTF